jgi:hypothetical protein
MEQLRRLEFWHPTASNQTEFATDGLDQHTPSKSFLICILKG